MKKMLSRLFREESGQDLIEYALLAAFISLAAIAAMRILAGGISGLFTRVSDELAGG